MEIKTGSSDSNSSRNKSSSFERVQRRSNELQYGRKKGSGVKHESEEKRGPRKKYRGDEIVMPSTSGYNFRPRRGTEVESRPTIEMKTQQKGPVRARKSREHHYSPYIKEQARSSSKNTRRSSLQ
ncbi:uncharacterized protein TNCV_3472731 [Trichonephila clavipes]|nr:uncharacterized protein TNCV_3472731 [Trichonephila clavipes]